MALCAAAGVVLATASTPAVLLAAAFPVAASAAAVLAAASGQVSIERPGTASPIAGTIGMRLLAGDTVKVGSGSSATVYLAGGGLVRIPAGSRIEIPREAIPGGGAASAASAGAAGATPPPTEASSLATVMSSRSVEVLEAGLWVLNDPDGSVLLSAMRGEADDWGATEGGALEPLSPRFETVFETRPRFVWSGPSPARVVVARGKEIVWRGSPSSLGSLTLPADAPELKHGEVYRWWLESDAGKTPPTESVPFRIAVRKAVGEAARFEKEVEGLSAGNDGQGLASLLRCGYYVEVGAWSRVVAAATDLRRSDPGSPAAERALEGSRRQMRLGSEGMSRLAPAAGPTKEAPAAAPAGAPPPTSGSRP
ncbi:MAG TPA: hypothetical protein VFD06_16015 [Candidatus Polarisedimenticolia bacterium]|nr:hypothetical protein [Candidatus Polarisedimenticolia bacterium]